MPPAPAPPIPAIGEPHPSREQWHKCEYCLVNWSMGETIQYVENAKADWSEAWRNSERATLCCSLQKSTKNDGMNYEPDSPRTMMAALHRHLREKKQQIQHFEGPRV